MSRSFRTMREGREALRRARENAGLSTDYVIDDVVVKESQVLQQAQPQQPQTPAQAVQQPTAAPEPASAAVAAAPEPQVPEVAPAPPTEVVEVMELRDPRLVDGEVALQKARIRRENAAMIQSCAMALFAGLSSVAVGIGLYQGRHKAVPAATPPAVK